MKYYIETRLKHGWVMLDISADKRSVNLYDTLVDANQAIVRIIELLKNYDRTISPSSFRIIKNS